MTFPRGAWPLLTFCIVCLSLWMLTKSSRESFQVLQPVPQEISDQVYSASGPGSQAKQDEELSSVIDANAPNGVGATGLHDVTVDAGQAQAVVQQVLAKVNEYTDCSLALVTISNCRKQEDVVGTQYMSFIFTAHDTVKFSTRQIGANVTIQGDTQYVQSIGYLNSQHDQGGPRGVIDVASQQQYDRYPSPFDNDW